jgi:hypothetical protein
VRGLVIALVLAAAAAGAARAVTPQSAAESADRPYEPIKIGDWNFVGNSDVTLMFIKPAPAGPDGGDRPRVLVRFEDASPMTREDFRFLSSVEVDDVDCGLGETRVVKVTRYSARNMMGEERVEDVAMPTWKAEAAGSFGAGILKAVCMPLPSDPTG